MPLPPSLHVQVLEKAVAWNRLAAKAVGSFGKVTVGERDARGERAKRAMRLRTVPRLDDDAAGERAIGLRVGTLG